MPDTPPARDLSDAELHRLADIILTKDIPDVWIEKVADAFWRRFMRDLKVGVVNGIWDIIWRTILRWGMILAAFGMAHATGVIDVTFPHNPNP